MDPNTSFRVAHQVAYGRYNIHLFENQLHFRAWMIVHPTKNMVQYGKGRKHLEYNHIGECDYAVADKQIELECAQ